ncbi:MAG: HAMP domain-containing sensor histidine kinase [Pseudomonadota bacterium]
MRNSIAARIRRSLLGLALGATVLLGAFALLLLYVIEDQLFSNQLSVEKAVLEKLPASERMGWQPGNRQMQLVWSLDALPPSVASVVGDRPGVYEHFDSEAAYFILRGTVTDPPADYFLLYDVSELLAVRQYRPALVIVFVVGVVAVGLLATAVALYLARKTLHPLRRLTQKLESGTGGELPEGFSEEFAGDEVGVLAEALESALQRVQSATTREFEFNRGVSHELRTPIQVAKGAVELLQMDAGRQPDTRSAVYTERLSRAIGQMEDVTEAFLWLASSRTLAAARTNAVAGIEALISNHAEAPGATTVQFDVDAADVDYKVPPPVFAVVVGNLLRNAAQHSAGGRVHCGLTQQEIVIENTRSDGDEAAEPEGFGVGLEIVRRICERLDWRLSLTQTDTGMQARLLIQQ